MGRICKGQEDGGASFAKKVFFNKNGSMMGFGITRIAPLPSINIGQLLCMDI
jgi:hypothetical protein